MASHVKDNGAEFPKLTIGLQTKLKIVIGDEKSA